MAQQVLPKTYLSLTHTHPKPYIYIYICINQFRTYQHLSTLKHPILIILLGNSNQQSQLTYNSSYDPPIQISTVQSKNQYVMDPPSKVCLNQTVNEPGNTIL